MPHMTFEYAFLAVTDWGPGGVRMAVGYPGLAPEEVMQGEDTMTMLARLGSEGWELAALDARDVRVESGEVARTSTFWLKRAQLAGA